MQLDTISGRIFATLAGVVVALLVAAAIFGQLMIQDLHQHEVETRLNTAAKLLADSAHDALASRSDRAAYNEHLHDLARELRLRLTVIDTEGTVIADSESTLPLANHKDRAEIIGAAAHGRGSATRNSATTGLPTRYVAWRVDEGGRTLGYARAAADPEAPLSEAPATLPVTVYDAMLVVNGLITLESLVTGLGQSRLALESQNLQRFLHKHVAFHSQVREQFAANRQQLNLPPLIP